MFRIFISFLKLLIYAKCALEILFLQIFPTQENGDTRRKGYAVQKSKYVQKKHEQENAKEMRKW